MKKILKLTLFALCFVFTAFYAHAQEAGEDVYTQSLVEQANQAMQQVKDEAKSTLETLKERTNHIPSNDARRQAALDLIGNPVDLGKKIKKDGLEKLVNDLQQISGLEITPAIGNAPPTVEFSEEFKLQQQKVEDGFTAVNRILLSPAKPATVPEGDIVEDFIPQLVRQFFRFAWVAIFISFVVSGVMLVMAMGNDERIDKAKKMLYFSLIGFAIIALAFAIVRAITDIDFFRFI